MPRKSKPKAPAKRKHKSTALVPVESKVHPWRLCPAGQHYRRETIVRAHTRNGRPVSGGPRAETCVHNPSGKDQLYREEIHEIEERNFGQFKVKSLGTIQEFKGAPYPQDGYDYLIQGWTRYWNDVLNPNEPLDPKLVKALIASESGLNPNSWNKRRGPGRARGLMQVTDGSIQNMKHGSPDFVDHFVNLTEDDMLDPCLTICAGIRWLYRKKQLASVNLGRTATWIEAVAEYKSYLKNFIENPSHIQMNRLIKIYEELKHEN